MAYIELLITDKSADSLNMQIGTGLFNIERKPSVSEVSMNDQSGKQPGGKCVSFLETKRFMIARLCSVVDAALRCSAANGRDRGTLNHCHATAHS